MRAAREIPWTATAAPVATVVKGSMKLNGVTGLTSPLSYMNMINSRLLKLRNCFWREIEIERAKVEVNKWADVAVTKRMAMELDENESVGRTTVGEHVGRENAQGLATKTEDARFVSVATRYPWDGITVGDVVRVTCESSTQPSLHACSGRNAQVQADCYRIVISKSGIIWGI